MANAALDSFGRILITNVRDEAISDWKMIVDGKMKSERAMKLRQKLASFSDEQRKVFLSLVPEVVDTVLHHFMSMIDQHDDITISIQAANQPAENLKDISDGLPGELYSDEGW